jgi:hypothetical protein
MAHICDRCGRESSSYILSMFNLDELCLDCKGQEEKHSLDEQACEAEIGAVRGGDFFPGIGWLEPKAQQKE